MPIIRPPTDRMFGDEGGYFYIEIEDAQIKTFSSSSSSSSLSSSSSSLISQSSSSESSSSSSESASPLIGYYDNFEGADLSAWHLSVGNYNLDTVNDNVDATAADENAMAYDSPVNTVDQFARIKLVSGSVGSEVFGVIFRYSAGSQYYAVYYDNQGSGTIYWERWNDTGYLGMIQSVTSPDFAVGDVFAATITGTGTNTVVRIFKNPVSLSPINATSWDSTDDYLAELTSDPSISSDTGKRIGITNWRVAGDNTVDDFYCGDIGYQFDLSSSSSSESSHSSSISSESSSSSSESNSSSSSESSESISSSESSSSQSSSSESSSSESISSLSSSSSESSESSYSSHSISSSESSISGSVSSSSESSSSFSAFAGSHVFGHDTGVDEYFKHDFSDGTVTGGSIDGSGDYEKVTLGSGNYWTSHIVRTGANMVKFVYGKYRIGSGSPGTFQFKTGSSKATCDADTWHDYTGPFQSSGWVQLRALKS